MDTEDEVYDPESEDYVIQSLTSDRVVYYRNYYEKKITTGTNTEKKINTSYNYSYDANGNITDIYKNYAETNYTNGKYTSTSRTIYHTRYTYDYLNQLIREDDEEAGYSYTYAYDNAGNRTSKKRYAYTLGTLGNPTGIFEYSYSSSGWGDRLIYDDDNYSDITYDSIGNPILIEDSDDPECYTSLTWNGRQLLSIAKYNPDYDGTISYAYNADGIRIKKEYGDWRWEYDLSGSTIIRARVYDVNTHLYTLLFMYDENGSPFAMSVKNANSGTVKTYYYEKNLQGDIVGIMNEAGYKVVSYTYDAWGNPYDPVYSYNSGVSSTDRNYAQLNPFRYRGYFYDVETGYYYLQTRYYSPDLGRFLNADGYVNANGDILGYNMFAYCGNNPVKHIDPNGESILFITTIINHIITGVEILISKNNVESTYSIDEAQDAISEITGDEVTFSEGNVKIKNSYNVHSRYNRIKASIIIKNTVDEDGNKFTDRSIYSLSSEWAGHNILSSVGHFFKLDDLNSHTDDVDLDKNMSTNAWYTKIGTAFLEVLGVQ